MLYEMLAGRPPFLGDDAVAVVSQHLNTPPVAPSWHNPEVSSALEALVLQLLAKVPDERPASGAEVRQRLREMSAAPAAASEPPPPAAAARITWGRFIGRAEELAALKAAVEAALGGRGSLVLVGGEPGIGKTRLTGEAIQEADGFFGKTVILAARIAAQARGGEILVSSDVRTAAEGDEDFRFAGTREPALKGLAGTYAPHTSTWPEKQEDASEAHAAAVDA